ncbi:MAG: hypothetical protein ACFB0G_24480 [Leptolyngbyaceae cyanobacterium]
MRIDLLALGAAVVIPVAIAAQPASAAKFSYDSQSIGGNQNVGVHKSITTTYDINSEVLTWSSTFAEKNGKLADGAWLVLSEGPNPKGDKQEYTMFYLDGVAEKLTAYTYNGRNGSNSWQDSNSVYLDSWDLDVSTVGNERTFSFAVDMTDINSRTDLGNDWKGTFYEEKIGIWFHGVADVDATYNASHELTKFNYSSQGWYDTANEDAEKVPEPFLAVGLGAAAAFGAVRRKRSTAV